MLILALSAALASHARAECVFRQDCDIAPGNKCTPLPTNSSQRTPFPQPIDPRTNTIICPKYADSACCTSSQVKALSVNFLLVNFTFGMTTGGGCPACAQNLIDFYCAFTCAPNQDEFLQAVGTTNMTDPISGLTIPVFVSQMTLEKTFACAAYDSCASTSKVQQDAALQGCENFFTFQGQTEAVQNGHSFLEFVYSDAGQVVGASRRGGAAAAGWAGEALAGSPRKERVAPLSAEALAAGLPETPAQLRARLQSPPVGAPIPTAGSLNIPTASCCNYPINTLNPALGNTSCPCSSCAGMCTAQGCGGDSGTGATGAAAATFTPLPVMNGFSGPFIAGWYAVVFVASVAVLGFRRWSDKRRAARAAAAEAAESDSAAPLVR